MKEKNYTSYVSLKKELDSTINTSIKELEVIFHDELVCKKTKFNKIIPSVFKIKKSDSFKRYEIINKKLKLLKHHIFEYEETLQHITLSKNDRKTIDELFDDIEESISILFSLIKSKKFLDYTRYLLIIRGFEEESRDIKHNLSLISNCINGVLSDPKKLDTTQLKKIKKTNLKKGDVIVECVLDKKTNFKNKVISTVLNSPTIHTSIVLDKIDNHVFVLEAVSEKEYNIRAHPLFLEKDITYVVLRSQQKLSTKQILILENFAKYNVGGDYSKLKVTGMLQNKAKNNLFRYFSFTKKEDSNSFSNISGHFCSELVVRAYKEMGIQIGNTSDPSLISPTEIFNSAEFEIIGILN